VIERMVATAAAADRTGREVALLGLRAGQRGTFRNMIGATRTWGGRIDLLRWMLVPVPASLRLGAPLRYPNAWPAYYLARPFQYLARRARRIVSPRP
jgi:hypothetical protein